ncbi:protealysin inhibitor emfourin [Polaromonas sp.]|uniref:protealysin inhibitor emfourin n=1 Tax=Polaromonas sp. TaxID=1869339 RepID=UPI0017DF9DB4|nr:protealysin inhibitor emfourin [Polaromonas sp.]NMM06292.1 hypothetical protein [Polaromonas sp.]
MDVILLIFTESGGFAGLKRGCTVAPAALPERPLEELQGLLQRSLETPRPSPSPDLQVYTLELVTANEAKQQTHHRVLQYLASDVPEDLSELISFLHEHAEPIALA